MPIVHNLFQEIKEEETLPISFHEINITLTAKPDEKEIYIPISLINISTKILNKLLENTIQQYKKLYTDKGAKMAA